MLTDAIDGVVECPDSAVDGEVDEAVRMMSRCRAVTAVIDRLPAMDAARILACASATLEDDREDCDGCLSMLVGEAVRIQARARTLEELMRENAELEQELDELEHSRAALEEAQDELAANLRNLEREMGKAGIRARRKVH